MKPLTSLVRSLAIVLIALTLIRVTPAAEKPATRESKDKDGWQSLFDGKELGKWKSTNFGGEGEVSVKDGALVLGSGEILTGANYTGKTPKMNYEVELDARRVNGSDFFCGLTVPVGDTFASLIIGGWGGSLCGISSFDGNDAANNDTATVQAFKNGEWYHIRLRVLPNMLQAWIDDKQIVDADTTGKKISTRHEVNPSKPFGISSYQTTAALKNIRLREIPKSELDAAKKDEGKRESK